jgi:hypothetical protein
MEELRNQKCVSTQVSVLCACDCAKQHAEQLATGEPCIIDATLSSLDGY